MTAPTHPPTTTTPTLAEQIAYIRNDCPIHTMAMAGAILATLQAHETALRRAERDVFRAYTEGWRKGHDTPKPAECSDYSEWRYAESEGQAAAYVKSRERIAALADSGSAT